MKEKYLVEHTGVGPDKNGFWKRPPGWPVWKYSDPDMGGRGKNRGKKRTADLEAQDEDADSPDLALSTDPNDIEDPITSHNHLFPRKNTPKGRVMQGHKEEGW